MMFPLCVLGAIVVSSMLVKAFFVGLPSSIRIVYIHPPPSIFFFSSSHSFSPHHYRCVHSLIRGYANDRMQRSASWGRHNGNLFLPFTRVIYHQTVFFFVVSSLSLTLPFFSSLPPSFFHRFPLVTVGCAVLLRLCGLVKREKWESHVIYRNLCV